MSLSSAVADRCSGRRTWSAKSIVTRLQVVCMYVQGVLDYWDLNYREFAIPDSIPSKFLDYQDFYSWDSSSKIIRISIIRKLFLEPIHPDNRGPPVCIMCCRYSKQAVHFFVALKVIDCHGQRKRLLRRWWWQVVCRQILYAWYNNYKSTDQIRCPGGFKIKTL